MKPLLLFISVLFVGLAVAADDPKKPPLPEGQPAYQRQTEGWWFGCWPYKDSKAVHGRLIGKDGEVFGKRDGETIETGFGTLVWRGHYMPGKPPGKSTGWLFIESFSGPPCIRDRHDTKTGTLPPP